MGGLPPVSYKPPVVATLSASIFLLLVMGFITLITGLTSATQISYLASNNPYASSGTLGICGLVSLLCLAGTIFFLVAVIKGVHDLFTPVYYTRGTVADKRVLMGRKTGNWLGMYPEYSGPDPIVAGAVNSEQAAASVDRSKIVQTRSTGSLRNPRPQNSYLSAERISLSDEAPPQETRPRRVFRVEPAAHSALSAGEEVLVAHSRHLEHIYYVAHLKDGEWVAHRNKALI